MYLKKIQLQGFKTFADKTELDFTPGISCIVGPNGSGKSNIADAVRWVLGEQSIKSLRGAKLEDIIFGGSKTRGPLNFAVVSLFIDNTCNSLPIEYTEVCITRKIYRSGESEYSINKIPCRLKDIQQLFLNTGVGRDSYSIIRQGEADNIFISRPEERRAIFEEASGINKYKYKKKEALRRLSETSFNLQRINDIIQEISSHLGPLNEAKNKALQYKELTSQLKNIEVNYLGWQIKNLKKRTEELYKNEELFVSLLENLQRELSISEEKLQKEKDNFDIIDKDIEQIQLEYPRLAKEIERIQGEIKLAQEKISSSLKKIEDVEKEIQNLIQQIEILKKNILTLSKNIEEVEINLNNKKNFLQENEKKILQQLDILEKEITSLEEKKSLAFDKAREQALKHNQIIYITKEIERINEENRKKTETLKILNENLKNIDIEIQKLRSDIDKINQDILEEEKEKESLKLLGKNLQTSLLNIKKERTEIQSDISSKESRLHTLVQLQYGSSEYAIGSKSILDNQALIEKGIIAKISNLIKVPLEFERVIEVALGVAIQYIVCHNENVAKQALEYLKEGKRGRATFISLDFFKDVNLEKQDLSDIKGVIGWAVDKVQCDKKYSDVINYLLKDVLIVEDLSFAQALIEKYKNLKIITKDADMVFSGIYSGGGTLKEKLGPLSIERNISSCREEISALKNRSIQKMKEEKKIITEIEEINKKINSLENKITDQKNNLIAMQTDIALKIKEKESYEAQYKTENYNFTKQEEYETLLITKDNLEKELNSLKDESEKLTTEIQFFQNSISERQKQKDEITERLTNSKIELAVIEQKKDNLYRQKQENDAQIIKLQEIISEKNNLIDDYRREIDTQNEKINNYKSNLEKLNQELLDKQKMLHFLKENKVISYEERKKEEIRQQETRKKIEEKQQELHKIQIEKAQIETELKEITAKLTEEYNIDYNEIIPNIIDVEDKEKTARAIKKLKNSISNLGPVNLSSIEEYETQSERYNFLSSQFNDLSKTHTHLLNFIKETDIKAKNVFLETFNRINISFNRIFQELFGGGYAKLFLLDKEDIFESGIEIEVQVPGKISQNILLLSGGEKSLVTISLLFALLDVKPTPFCIFDEIDATLDDANIKKFTNMLSAFSKNSQFILITHTKGTMEVADTLYGITMEEDGISKLISVKLEDKNY